MATRGFRITTSVGIAVMLGITAHTKAYEQRDSVVHGLWASNGRIEQTATGGVFYSEVKSPLGLYTYDGNVVVTPDGHWAAADYPVVIRTDTGSVAERAGLLPGDVVLTVNGRDARGGNAAWRLRPTETSYVLHVQRGETEMDIVMERPERGNSRTGGSPTPRE